MATSRLEEEANRVLERLLPVCHLADMGTRTILCGEGIFTTEQHDEYNGSEICGTCGRSTCPACARVDALQCGKPIPRWAWEQQRSIVTC